LAEPRNIFAEPWLYDCPSRMANIPKKRIIKLYFYFEYIVFHNSCSLFTRFEKLGVDLGSVWRTFQAIAMTGNLLFVFFEKF
jgi:hypothetical protein